MKMHLIPALIFFLWAANGAAQKGQISLTVATDPSAGGGEIVLCCTPSDLFGLKDACTYEWVHPVGGTGGKDLSIPVKRLCIDLKANATVVALDGRWYVSRKAQPGEALFLIDCRSEKAQALVASPPSPPLPESTPAPSGEASVSASSSKEQQGTTEKVQKRLRELEDALSKQKSAVQSLEDELKKRGAADRELEKKFDALQKELLEKVRALEEGQKNSCFRVDDRYQGQEEVTVAVAGSVLRFLKVKPREATVPIGLSEAKAGEFLAEAQARETRPIFPHIYLAVPEKKLEVEPFFLQDRLIDPQLYSRFSGDKDAGRVSHQDAIRFIAALNTRCKGQVRFTLPSEEQLVAAAQRIYDPVADGFKTCEALRKEDLRSDITELFGHAWQLTNSPCQPFGKTPKETCPENSFVRKGGAASSTNFLECLPEYRSPAPDDVSQQETSFRLALVD